jgi:transposase-like protein
LTVAVIGLLAVRRLRATRSGGPGSVLVELSVVEQRYRAVLAVLAGESVTAVAAHLGVSRQTVHTWLSRYRDEGLGGLVDRSHRPEFCPHQSPFEVESAVCELRRVRPRWGPRRRAPGAHVQRADRGGEQPDQSGSSKWRSASGASRATGSGRCSTPAASTGTYSPRSHAAEVRRAPLPRPAPSSSSILGLPGSRLLAARCDRRSRMDLDVVVDFPARCAMGSQDRPGEF